jgi:hypothetical protein
MAERATHIRYKDAPEVLRGSYQEQYNSHRFEDQFKNPILQHALTAYRPRRAPLIVNDDIMPLPTAEDAAKAKWDRFQRSLENRFPALRQLKEDGPAVVKKKTDPYADKPVHVFEPFKETKSVRSTCVKHEGFFMSIDGPNIECVRVCILLYLSDLSETPSGPTHLAMQF